MSKDSKEPEVLGEIRIAIHPGGVKKATFKGEVGYNDINTAVITLQYDYAMYLNERHYKNKNAGKEALRVAAEKKAVEDEKALKIQQEKELADKKLENDLKVAEALVAELKVVDTTQLTPSELSTHKTKFNQAKNKLAKLKK